MAFISFGDENDRPAELDALLDRFRDKRTGVVDNILRIHSHNPPSLDAHVHLYETLMRGKSELSRAQREMIAVIVSGINGCVY